MHTNYAFAWFLRASWHATRPHRSSPLASYTPPRSCGRLTHAGVEIVYLWISPMGRSNAYGVTPRMHAVCQGWTVIIVAWARRKQTSRIVRWRRRPNRYRCHITIRCSMCQMSADFTDVRLPMFTSVVLYCRPLIAHPQSLPGSLIYFLSVKYHSGVNLEHSIFI